MKKLLKACLSIFLSFLMCFMAVPVMAAEQAEEVYGEAYQITMPIHYRQGDPRWSNIRMQSCNLPIGTHGCALTSFAMIVNYYGYQHDPAMVNEELKTLACDLQYGEAGLKYNLTLAHIGYYDNTLTMTAAIDYIKPHIIASRPVLVGIKKGTRTHFVVAYGYIDLEELGTTNPYIPILDPSDSEAVGCNKTSLKQYYDDGWAVHRIFAYDEM